MVTFTILGGGGTSDSPPSALVTSSTVASSASGGTDSEGFGSGIPGDADGSSLSSGTSSVHFSKRYMGKVDEKAECLWLSTGHQPMNVEIRADLHKR